MTQLTRRRALQAIGGTTLMATIAPLGVAFAAAPTEQRLILVILRGGLDGLHAVPPHADPDYRRLRPSLALPPPRESGGALDLDGGFGLHPALAPLAELYRARELLVVPAATTSYRARSHFDGQNVLETGATKPFGAADGWLNRAIGVLGGGREARLGLAVGPTVPIVLRGASRVRTWAATRMAAVDDDFLHRLGALYAGDPLFAAAHAVATGKTPDMDGVGSGHGRRPRLKFVETAQAAANLLASTAGPRIAVLEADGWDTHTNQAARLNQLFAELAEGLAGLKPALGSAWPRTAVVIVSEFGRTAAQNGNNGTDHGTGGVALVLGGAIAGGRIAGTWPGLAPRALFEGRDVRAETDYRSLFKGLLHEHLAIGEAALESNVFPDSRSALPMLGLVRRA